MRVANVLRGYLVDLDEIKTRFGLTEHTDPAGP